ncbi:hypothetical protein MASR2M16_01690 [Thauera terpenica]
MEIDLKHLKALIAAEIVRRDCTPQARDAFQREEGGEPSSRHLADLVRAFEPLELEELLPAPEVLEPAPEAPTPSDTGAARLYLKLRRTPLGRILDHPRVLGLLNRARQRPGGATMGNVLYLLLRGVLLRLPVVAPLYTYIAVSRRLPARVAALELELAQASTALRNVGLVIQDQVNQSLYTHAVAAQSNDALLLRRFGQLEQRLRELTRSPPQAQAAQPPSSAAQPNSAAPAEGLPPELYGAFEEQFRGSRALISARLRANLPRFAPVWGPATKPVLDLGCGRGEWLQLLAEHGIVAEGVDSSPWMVRSCLDAGLSVRQGDAIEYLAALPDDALAGLTGFHIIEHLPIAVLIRLIEHARRVVQPGGVVLFETPNPENLVVGACNFYVDPTHRNPLPPALMAFLLEEHGFERVEIERRHPADAARLAAGELAEPLATLVFGPQDYAVIGHVPHKAPACI